MLGIDIMPRYVRVPLVLPNKICPSTAIRGEPGILLGTIRDSDFEAITPCS
jgi:hypothetical protein